MKQILMLFLLLSTLLTGCVEKEILDDVNLESGSAYDYIDGELRGTALVPIYLQDKSVENKIYTASSVLSRDFLQNVQRQAQDPIVTGSLEVVLFGEQLAREKGIIDLIDSFQRDPSIGAGIFLAETQGEAKKLLEGNYGTRGTALYISSLITHNMKTRDLPKTNIQRFLADFNQRGKTPYLPQLKKLNKKQIEISGISFFRYGRIVDSIPAARMFYFKLMVDKYSQGSFKVKLKKAMAAVESIRSNYKLQLVSRDPYTVNVKIKVNAILNEFSGPRVTPKEIKEIEQTLAKKIESECKQLTKQFQEKNIDPVGFGHFVKSKTRGFDFNKWETDYKHLNVTVHADVTIMESGVIE